MFKRFFVKGIVSSAHLEEPKIFQNGDSKYSIRLCVDVNDSKSISELDKWNQSAMLEGKKIWVNGEGNSGITSPFKEDFPYGTAYANYRILDLSTRESPAVFQTVCANHIANQVARNIFVRIIRRVNSQKLSRVDKVVAYSVGEIGGNNRYNFFRNILHWEITVINFFTAENIKILAYSSPTKTSEKLFCLAKKDLRLTRQISKKIIFTEDEL